MAHSLAKKAQAMAMLLTGDSVRYVASQTGVPLTTVKRWQREAFADLRGVLGDPLAEAARILASGR